MWFVRRRKRPGDDRGSMPVAMLVVLVGTTVTATVANVVVTDAKDSTFAARRVQVLSAAQAGLDAGRAQVRAAIDPSTGDGKRSLLPCDPISGAVDALGQASYTVQATYYLTDPQDMTDAELEADKQYCVEGTGPAKTPLFVVFTSTGQLQGEPATRTLRGTYIVHTTNANISGGLIHVYRPDSTYNDLCMDAGSKDPAPGTQLRVKLCSAGAVAQTWAYTDKLQIVLVSSQTPTHPYGMCLDAGPPASHAAGVYVVLQQCQANTPARYQQAWSFNDSANMQGSNAAGTDVDSYCFNVVTANTSGSLVWLQKNCGGSYNNVTTFSADANVGAGQASSKIGWDIGQLVNYNQFGRCLDDTGNNANATHMIAWPCKQNPNPTKVSWNQRYALPALNGADYGTANNHATGVITTATGGVTYCVQSPGSTALGKYVRTIPCDGSAAQTWTVYGRTDMYATSYQIVDYAGFCLTPRDPTLSNPDLYQAVNKISKIYVATCDGSTLEKWNADKNVIDAMALKDVQEK